MKYVVLGYRNLIAQPVDVTKLPKTGLAGLVETIGLDDILESIDMAPFEEAGTDIRLHLSGTGIGRGNIFERIELHPGAVIFRLLPRQEERRAEKEGIYLEPHSGNDSFPQGALLLRRQMEPNADHVFREIWLPEGGVALETRFGTYVTAENDGKVSEIVVDRDVIGDWQRFDYLVPPADLLPASAPEREEQSFEDRLKKSTESGVFVVTPDLPGSKLGDLQGILQDAEPQKHVEIADGVGNPFTKLMKDEDPKRQVRRIDTQP